MGRLGWQVLQPGGVGVGKGREQKTKSDWISYATPVLFLWKCSEFIFRLRRSLRLFSPKGNVGKSKVLSLPLPTEGHHTDAAADLWQTNSFLRIADSFADR